MKRLIQIQSKLKANKDQYNSFGKYKYRSCEDILEAVKPLLKEQNLALIISDKIVTIADRVFLKATCKLFTDSNQLLIKNSALAEIPTEKKGMDLSQITGSSSSYARKYALNGLFCIDDTKDADTQPPISEKQTSKKTKTTIKTEPTQIQGPQKRKEYLTPLHPKWNNAKTAIKDGKTTIEAIKNVYTISVSDEKKLFE